MIIQSSHSKLKAYLSLLIFLCFIAYTSFARGASFEESDAERLTTERGDAPKVAVQQGEPKGGGGKKTLLIVGGLIVLGGILYMVLKPSDTAEDTEGNILINSTPEGADIYLDGNNTGRTTNGTLTNIPVGPHTVKLLKDGYGDWEEAVTVEGGKTVTVDANLIAHTIAVTQPKSRTNWTHGEEVQIKWATRGGQSQSNSFGLNRAQLRLNRAFRSARLRGAFLPNLCSRSAKRVSRGHKGESSERERGRPGLAAGMGSSAHGHDGDGASNHSGNPQINRLSGMNALVKAPPRAKPSGDITIQTLSNIKIELLRNNTVEEVIAENTTNTGSHSWTVSPELPEASNYSVRVSCATDSSVSGESERFSISSQVGKIKVNSTPTGATIWLDGQKTGKTTNTTLHDVPVGSHSIKLTKERYQDWEDTVTVTKNTTKAVNATLKVGAFTEDFDDGVADHFIEEHPSLWTVDSGVYKFEGDQTGQFSTSHYDLGNFSDFTFRARGNREMTQDCEWGIIFRANKNASSFYFLFLYPDEGRWSIYRHHFGSTTTVTLANSGRIDRAMNAWNEIEIEARGEEFKVSINGHYVNTVTIPGISPTGRVGLVAETNTDFVKIDDLTLSLPTTGEGERH
ncbi:MAG: PEGA domain-containing protein [Candidatus Aminicenantes bacterium]